MPIAFLLNGKPVDASGFPPHTTLLECVRQLGLTGSKEGCAEGECGACAMLMVRSHGGKGSAYVPFNGCLMLLPMAAGQEIYTVEALARNGQLHEVQQAMISYGGSQCGYCTPGFVVSMFAEQYRRDRVGACDPMNLGGNLCRCTGYRPIRDALASLSVPVEGDPFLERLEHPAPPVGPVSLPEFSRPSSVRECVELLSGNHWARVVAGGTDLGVDNNLKGERFSHLVSVESLWELRVFDDYDHSVVIGAGLPLNEIPWSYGPFRQWLQLFASPLIRNRATLGGNLATASPIGDAAPFLLALDAIVQISGGREIPLSDFFLGRRATRLKQGELIVSIRIPKPLPSDLKFYKVAKRRMDDISTVAAAIAVGERGSRIAFGGVAPTPVQCFEAEEALAQGKVREAKQWIAQMLKPISDHRGSADYRLAMAQSLIDKFWHESGRAA